MNPTRRTRRLLGLIACVLLALVLGLIVHGATGRPEIAAAAAWTTFVSSYCAWIWLRLARLSPAETAAHSREEDPGRWVSDLILIVASVASVAGVGYILIAGNAHDVANAALGAACVLASWVLVHTLYGVRYADLYFSAPSPPIDFGDEPPRYIDFAYLTFCLGMTYQISNTTIRTSQLRSVVLWHTLLSYFLGAVVLACTVNLVAGLAAS